MLPVCFNIMLSIRLFSVLQRRQIFPFLIFFSFSSNPNENFFVVVVIFLLKGRELTWFFSPMNICGGKKMQRVLTKHAKCFINQSTRVEMKALRL